jgi:hypothetical protein
MTTLLGILLTLVVACTLANMTGVATRKIIDRFRGEN